MTLELLSDLFSVCQLESLDFADASLPVFFLAKTRDEISWVGPSVSVPQNVLKREDGWRAFQVRGVLDFSLVGILSRLTSLMAEKSIPVFALSTYNTDYLLIRQERLPDALAAFSDAGISVSHKNMI